MVPVIPELTRLAGDALVILLHLAAALSHLREGNVNSAVKGFTDILDNAVPGRYVNEAQFWRARVAASQDERQARAAAARDYVDMLKRLQEGPLKREVSVRLAALTEPGRLLTKEEAIAATQRGLARIGHALHEYAADHGGAFPQTLYDLLDGYVSDASLLVRPGPAASGGGKIYLYQHGLKADLKMRTDPDKRQPIAIDGVPAIVWEAVAAEDGTRLILRIDGELRSAKITEPGE